MILKRERGKDVIRWEQRDRHIRNEPLDCRVYAAGAYEILNPRIISGHEDDNQSAGIMGHKTNVSPKNQTCIETQRTQRKNKTVRIIRGGMMI